VSHTLADQTSILRLIEDHWLRGERISETSFDRLSGSLLDLFDFARPMSRTVILDPTTGLPVDPTKVSPEGGSRAPGVPWPPATR
jgi:phospholipase C